MEGGEISHRLCSQRCVTAICTIEWLWLQLQLSLWELLHSPPHPQPLKEEDLTTPDDKATGTYHFAGQWQLCGPFPEAHSACQRASTSETPLSSPPGSPAAWPPGGSSGS